MEEQPIKQEVPIDPGLLETLRAQVVAAIRESAGKQSGESAKHGLELAASLEKGEKVSISGDFLYGEYFASVLERGLDLPADSFRNPLYKAYAEALQK